MRIASFFLVTLVACGTSPNADDTPGPDATFDQAATDATKDTGVATDSGIDSGTDSGSMDAGDTDSGVLDSGDDGSICPPCINGWTCCTVMKSFNYGKCYDSKCLACCM